MEYYKLEDNSSTTDETAQSDKENETGIVEKLRRMVVKNKGKCAICIVYTILAISAVFAIFKPLVQETGRSDLGEYNIEAMFIWAIISAGVLANTGLKIISPMKASLLVLVLNTSLIILTYLVYSNVAIPVSTMGVELLYLAYTIIVFVLQHAFYLAGVYTNGPKQEKHARLSMKQVMVMYAAFMASFIIMAVVGIVYRCVLDVDMSDRGRVVTKIGMTKQIFAIVFTAALSHIGLASSMLSQEQKRKHWKSIVLLILSLPAGLLLCTNAMFGSDFVKFTVSCVYWIALTVLIVLNAFMIDITDKRKVVMGMDEEQRQKQSKYIAITMALMAVILVGMIVYNVYKNPEKELMKIMMTNVLGKLY